MTAVSARPSAEAWPARAKARERVLVPAHQATALALARATVLASERAKAADPARVAARVPAMATGPGFPEYPATANPAKANRAPGPEPVFPVNPGYPARES